MNASLQCLRTLPELGTSLRKYQSNDQDPDAKLAKASYKLWNDLDTSKAPVDATVFWTLLRQAYPTFDQKGVRNRPLHSVLGA